MSLPCFSGNVLATGDGLTILDVKTMLNGTGVRIAVLSSGPVGPTFFSRDRRRWVGFTIAAHGTMCGM